MTSRLRCYLAAAVVLTAACATTHNQSEQVPPQQIAMGGSVILATPDPALGLATYDDASVFQAAAEAERTGDHAKAHELYGRLLHEMPASDLIDAARFNDGLVYEHEQAWGEAAAAYAPIIAAPRPVDEEHRRTWLDAHYRRAACLSKVQAWPDVARIFDVVIALADLSERDRIEALVGRGIAAKNLGDIAAAELMFGQVMHAVRVSDRTTSDELRDFAAEAAFQWAEIARDRFNEIKLAFPNDVLARLLDAKCQALLTAQTRYIRAVQFGDEHTLAAAGTRIGGLYTSLYDELVGLEVPPDLTDEERKIYRNEVKRRVRVLAEKAIAIYERTVLVGKRVDTAESWVHESEAALERLRAAYLDDDG